MPQATWDAAKQRQRMRQAEVGDKIRKGLKKSCGREPRHAFSGLIKCEVCGSSFVMKSARAYACSGYVNGRVCSNNIHVRRDILEDRLSRKIQTDLLRDEIVAEFRSRLARALRRPNPMRGRREALAREIEHIVDAIGKGLLSPALSARLQAAEQELASLQGSDTVVNAKDVLRLIGPAVDAYRRRVCNLPETIRTAPDVARKVIRDGVGPIVVAPRDGYLVAKMGLELQPLLASGGLTLGVVAGARFLNSERVIEMSPPRRKSA